MSKWKEAKAAEEARKQKEQKQPTLEEFEEGMASDIDELQKAFRERAQKEQQRFADVTNTDYYFVVCFSNYKQLVEFCDMLGIMPDDLYHDGREFARKMKKALSTPDTDFPKIQPFNKDYVARAREKK